MQASVFDCRLAQVLKWSHLTSDSSIHRVVSILFPQLSAFTRLRDYNALYSVLTGLNGERDSAIEWCMTWHML